MPFDMYPGVTVPFVGNHQRTTRPPAAYVFWKIVVNVVMSGFGTSEAKFTHGTLRPLAKGHATPAFTPDSAAASPELEPPAPSVPEEDPGDPEPPEPPLPPELDESMSSAESGAIDESRPDPELDPDDAPPPLP